VSVTRRELLTAAMAYTSSALVAEANPSRGVTLEFKAAMTTLFWVGEPSDAENNFIPNTRVIGTTIGKRVMVVLMTLNTEIIIGQQGSGLRKTRSTWHFRMGSLPRTTT